MRHLRSIALIAIVLFCSIATQAQHFYYGPPPPPVYYGSPVYGVRPAHPHYNQRRPPQKLPAFQPALHLNVGYGFPNLAQYELVDFQGVYRGNVSQTGPINASLDYQFSRFMSLGIMGMYGKVSNPYYDYNGYNPAMRGTLENWTIMANMINYIPASEHVTPYFRLALGVNIWNQDYYDYDSGLKADYVQKPTDFAYQASFGCKFNFTKQTGLFIEGGYGKYILNAGLSFKL